MKKCNIFFVLALFGSRWLAAAQTTEIKKVPVSSTRPDSGVEMFKTYCAAVTESTERAAVRPPERSKSHRLI
jgi:hypothetical protein